MGLGPHGTLWAGLSGQRRPRRKKLKCFSATLYLPPYGVGHPWDTVWGWAPMGHGGLAYRPATTSEKKLKCFLYRLRAPTRVGHPWDPVWGWDGTPWDTVGWLPPTLHSEDISIFYGGRGGALHFPRKSFQFF